MTKCDYPYASGPLLEERNTYTYSQYHGEGFFTAWRESRAAFSKSLQAAGAGIETQPREKTPFILLSERLLPQLEGNDSEAYSMLDKLLQRWEVTKRVYSEYKQDWRPVDRKDYKRPDHYLRFAQLLNAAYLCTGHLTYLNGLFKIMDTLSTLHTQFNDPERKCLLELIADEEAHLHALYRKHIDTEKKQ